MASDIVAYGIYPDRLAFERALEALRAAGFRNSDISAILPDRDQTTRDLAPEINTKAPEGFTTGASTGAAIGGVLGWLVGIGALVIPGIGPIVAAGPVVAALAGAGAAGATGEVQSTAGGTWPAESGTWPPAQCSRHAAE